MNVQIQMNEIARIAEELDALCGGDEICFADMVLGETDIDRIVLRIHEQVARDEEMLAGIKDRKAALADRQKRIELRRDNGKAFIGKALRIARLAKLELPEVTYSVRDGKAKLVVVDADAVPPEFCRVKTEPDKALINESFADTEALPNWLVWEAPRDVVTGRTR